MLESTEPAADQLAAHGDQQEDVSLPVDKALASFFGESEEDQEAHPSSEAEAEETMDAMIPDADSPLVSALQQQDVVEDAEMIPLEPPVVVATEVV